MLTLNKSLRPFVKDIWVTESNSFMGAATSFQCFADGSPGIIFQQTEQGMYLNRYKRLSSIFLYGQTVKPVEIDFEGNLKMIVIYFHPHVLKNLFGLNANEITDTCLDFSLLPPSAGRRLSEQLINIEQTEIQIELLCNFLHQMALGSKQEDSCLRFAVEQIKHTKGEISLRKLHDYLNVTERTFERRFEQHVGISAKLFARICRFQAVLSHLNGNNYSKLSDIALDSGYFDQAHFIKSFKEFAGVTPLEYTKKNKALLFN